jgi:hypothetical protein
MKNECLPFPWPIATQSGVSAQFPRTASDLDLKIYYMFRRLSKCHEQFGDACAYSAEALQARLKLVC